MTDDERAKAPVYFGVKNGRLGAVIVRDGDERWQNEVSKTVTEWLRDGYDIMNGTVAEARQFMFGPVADLAKAREQREGDRG